MALPAKKMSKTRSRNKRSHQALGKVGLAICSNCSQEILPHTACKNCGYYKGKQVTKPGK